MLQKKVSATIHVTAVIDGQDGNGIQSVARTYAISSQATTASDTTPPSDVTAWAAASPATTEAKPYLWAKEVVTYTKSAATTKYYMIGARGQNGIDAQDIEWAYIRTKTNVAPVIKHNSSADADNNMYYTDSYGAIWDKDDFRPVASGRNGSIEANDLGLDDSSWTGSTDGYGECTDEPNGVNDEWRYEWEIKREKGTADSNGHRSWQPYSGTMTLHNSMVNSITSANVWYALSTAGPTDTPPADEAFSYDDFPTRLNAGYYVWQATKVVLSDGSSAMTAKMCLGPTTDFLSGTEVYAISTSNETPPAENTTNWKTTYTKTKGYYLWTATRVQYTNGTYAYLNKKCVGYWGEDGNGIASVTRTYAVSSQATTASDTTPPSDVTTWAAASPATTEAKPYLWAKEVVTYTKAAATTKYYMIGARGQNGIDAQDIEWAYIRTKTNVAPVIKHNSSADADNNMYYTDSYGAIWDKDDFRPVASGRNGSIEANDLGLDDSSWTGSTDGYGECTDEPNGVNDEWRYEWEIKREKGTADSNGHRSWQPYSGTMTLHNSMVNSITSANVWYALTQSATTTPADSAYTLDDFPTTLNAGYYVWQATKVVLSDGSSAMTAKMCLGPTTDFLSGTEVYAISTSNETPPAENTTNWKTTYTKTKGYYLWTATRVQYTNGTYAYLNKKCVGYWGEDGANADYIYLRGTGSNNPGNRLLFISSQINQSSYQGSGRGIEIVTVSRNSLAKDDSKIFDTYGGTNSGHDNQTAACNAAAEYLNSLDNSVFVCITSLDAIGWNDNLIAALKNFGLGDLAYCTETGRYPFAFLGYKGLQEGYALWQIHGTEATEPHSEVSAYIANGLFMSSKDGETTPVYSLVLDHTSIDFRSDATGTFLQQNKSVECTVRKREGSDSETAVSQSSGTYDGYYLRCRRVYRNNAYQSWQDSNIDTITTALAIYSDTNTNPVVGVEFCLSKTSSPTSSSIIATASCAVICDGRRGAEGATGRMFRPRGTYNSSATYVRDNDFVDLVFFDDGVYNNANGARGHYYYISDGYSSNVSGSTHYAPASTDGDGNSYPYSAGVWSIASDFGVVITQAIFAEYAKMGSAIITGDWMISQHGTADGVFYNSNNLLTAFMVGSQQKTSIHPYTLFNGSSPTGGLVSVATYNTTISSSETSHNIIAARYLKSGLCYKITCRVPDGYTFSGVPLQIQIDKASTYDPITLLTVSEEETVYTTYVMVPVNTTYRLRLMRSSTASQNDTISTVIEQVTFGPQYAVDLLTGLTYMVDAYVKGDVIRPVLTMTQDNSAQYVIHDSAAPATGGNLFFVDLPQAFRTVQITMIQDGNGNLPPSGVVYILLPEVRQQDVGVEMTVLNATRTGSGALTMVVRSGDSNPKAGGYGSLNRWLLNGIFDGNINAYPVANGGDLRVIELAPQDELRLRAVELPSANNVNTGSRGWIALGQPYNICEE